jgi:hypothetical protein
MPSWPRLCVSHAKTCSCCIYRITRYAHCVVSRIRKGIRVHAFRERIGSHRARLWVVERIIEAEIHKVLGHVFSNTQITLRDLHLIAADATLLSLPPVEGPILGIIDLDFAVGLVLVVRLLALIAVPGRTIIVIFFFI